MINIISERKYQSHKYYINGLDRYDNIIGNKNTDDPKMAISKWCKVAATTHGNADILADSKDSACELIDWAYDNKDKVAELMIIDHFPYKHDYILNAIDKQHDNRCRGFYDGEYPDSVYPFSAG